MAYPNSYPELRAAYNQLKEAISPVKQDSFFITSLERIKKWLANANVPYQTQQELMLTISTIK
jgi:hypothetical protein